MPHAAVFDGTTIGGLSGIDYDPRAGSYLFISDDRSKINPARFYTAKIELDESGLGDVTFTAVTFFRRPDGATYPSIEEWALVQDGYSTTDRVLLAPVDPEELRVDPRTGNLLWSSEGVPEESAEGTAVLVDPVLRLSAPDGSYLRDLPIPKNMLYTAEAGSRPDHSIESLAFARGGELVVSALEDPLLLDGPMPTQLQGALTRITVQAVDGELLAQYAYWLDELPTPEGAEPAEVADGNTGISSIVAWEPDTSDVFLVVERAWVSGFGNRIRIYKADFSGATDVLSVPSLGGAQIEPVRKTLLVDLADTGLESLQNVEGITWGPDLATGEGTLLLVSDDNFSERQSTQIVALAVNRGNA